MKKKSEYVKPRRICLNPNHGEERSAKTRGLCQHCYNTARELIKKGRTTWAHLEGVGKAMPVSEKRGDGMCASWLLEEEKPRRLQGAQL